MDNTNLHTFKLTEANASLKDAMDLDNRTAEEAAIIYSIAQAIYPFSGSLKKALRDRTGISKRIPTNRVLMGLYSSVIKHLDNADLDNLAKVIVKEHYGFKLTDANRNVCTAMDFVNRTEDDAAIIYAIAQAIQPFSGGLVKALGDKHGNPSLRRRMPNNEVLWAIFNEVVESKPENPEHLAEIANFVTLSRFGSPEVIKAPELTEKQKAEIEAKRQQKLEQERIENALKAKKLDAEVREQAAKEARRLQAIADALKLQELKDRQSALDRAKAEKVKAEVLEAKKSLANKSQSFELTPENSAAYTALDFFARRESMSYAETEVMLAILDHLYLKFTTIEPLEALELSIKLRSKNAADAKISDPLPPNIEFNDIYTRARKIYNTGVDADRAVAKTFAQSLTEARNESAESYDIRYSMYPKPPPHDVSDIPEVRRAQILSAFGYCGNSQYGSRDKLNVPRDNLWISAHSVIIPEKVAEPKIPENETKIPETKVETEIEEKPVAKLVSAQHKVSLEKPKDRAMLELQESQNNLLRLLAMDPTNESIQKALDRLQVKGELLKKLAEDPTNKSIRRQLAKMR